MFGLKWGEGERGEAGEFEGVDLKKVFAEATIRYAHETPLEEHNEQDLSEWEKEAAQNVYLLEGFLKTTAGHVAFGDEATERALHEKLHPSVILSGYQVGDQRAGMLDVPHILAQEFLARSPETCKRVASEYGLRPNPFDQLGNRRADVASFYLGRLGTRSEQEEQMRRQELSDGVLGRIQLGVEDAIKREANKHLSLVAAGAFLQSAKALTLKDFFRK